MIEISNSEDFFRYQKQLKVIPFTQSEAWYGMTVAKGAITRFFIDAKTNTSLAIWGVESKVPLFNSVIFRVSGEARAAEVDEKTVQAFYSTLASLYKAVELDSNTKYNVEMEVGLRRAGYRRPIGVFSCPLTLENNLAGEQSRNRRWKRSVKLAEKANLVVKEVSNPDNTHINDFVAMFEEMSKTKGMTHVVSHEEISNLLAHNSIKLYAIATPKEEVLAYRLIQVHNDYAYDIFAANSNKSRDYKGATYLLMEQLFKSLKDKGVVYFDFGRIPPSNHSTDKIYEFKIGARGEKVQYNGEWVNYKSLTMEILVFLYKYFKLKKQRY